MKKPLAWPWWLLVMAYFSVTCLGHLAFSLWLVRGRTLTWGGQTHVFAFSSAVPWVAALAASLLVFHVWRGARRATKARSVLAYWLLWAMAVVLVDRYLTYSANEYAHLPQYGLLAWLLARALDPQRVRWPLALVLFGTTALGAVDELAQYLWITRSYSSYLDFNDILVNMLGAAGGMMLYYGFAQPPAARSPGHEARLVLAGGVLVLAGAVAGVSMRWVQITPPVPLSAKDTPLRLGERPALYLQMAPGFYGHRQPGRRHGRYWVLGPVPGLALTWLAGLSWVSFGMTRKVRAVRHPAG